MKCGRVVLIGFALMCLSELTSAQSQTMPPHAMNSANAGALPVALDIPSQPLELALKAFSDETHISLFYESGVISGRRSFALRGEYLAEAALPLMLQGTGLSSVSFERGTITILAPAQADEAAEISRAKARVAEFAPYLALVQKSLDQAFCRAPAVANDLDEMFVRLWLAPSGRALRADLLSGTGTDLGDRIYLTMLESLAIDARPPAAMPQPINLMILPKKSRTAAICASLGTASRRVTHE